MASYKPLTIPEAKELLEKEGAKRDLSFEQKAALQHSATFSRLTPEKARKLVGDLMKIENMTETLAVKLSDLLPEHPDDVKVIFAKERFALDQKIIEEILGIINKYL
jgi:DNA-directed RNA polymerase subunit F